MRAGRRCAQGRVESCARPGPGAARVETEGGTRMDRTASTAARLLDGALAGTTATWIMGKLTSYLYAQEKHWVREREDSARQGGTAYGAAAEKIANLVGKSLTDEQRESYGQRLHWALGAAAGVGYTLL